MKKILGLIFLFTFGQARADLQMMDYILDKKTGFPVNEKCYKALKDMPDSFKSDALKGALITMADMKFDDQYFFHYTNTTQVPFLLQSEIRDRALAHRKIIADGGYKEILEFQMTFAESLNNASGQGLYLAANPFSSATYGTYQVTFKISPRAKVLNMIDPKTASTFAAAQKQVLTKNPGIGNCLPKVIESLLYDENGADLVYYHAAPHEWMVLFNEDMIEGSDILSMNTANVQTVASAMLINGNFEPLIPYMSLDQKKKHPFYPFSPDWVLTAITSGKIENTYVLVDPSNAEDLKLLANVITQKDKMTFTRHLNYLNTKHVDYRDTFLNLPPAVFLKGNNDFFQFVADSIILDPSVLTRMTNMIEKLSFLNSKNFFSVSMMAKAKISFVDSIKIFEAMRLNTFLSSSADKIALTDYLFSTYQIELKAVPEINFFTYMNGLFYNSTDLAESKDFLAKVKKVGHPTSRVLESLSTLRSPVSAELLLHYLSAYLTPEEAKTYWATVTNVLKKDTTYLTLKTLINSKNLSDVQKNDLIYFYVGIFGEAVYPFLIEQKLVAFMSAVNLAPVEKFIYQKGSVETVKSYVSQFPATSARDLSARGLKLGWGIINEEMANLILNDSEKNPTELKNLLEGKDGLSFDHFLARYYPSVNPRILEKQKDAALNFIEKNYRSLPSEYSGKVLTFSYFGEKFKQIPMRTQVDFIKTQLRLIGASDLDQFILSMNLDEASASDLLNFLVDQSERVALHSIYEFGHKILASASLGTFEKTCSKISELSDSILLKEDLLKLLRTDKKIILLWSTRSKIEKSAKAKLVSQLLGSYPLMTREEKNLLASRLGSNWDQSQYRDLEDKFFDLSFSFLKESGTLESWYEKAHLMVTARFQTYLSGLVELNSFVRFYQTTAWTKTSGVVMNRILREAPATDFKKIEAELKASYPASNASYAQAFFEFMEISGDGVVDLEAKKKIVKSHLESNLCKEINEFTAIKELIKVSEKELKKTLKDLREKYCL